jgi:hypothetical protein
LRLVDIIPDVDVLLALEPDELGLRMLPVLASFRHPGMTLQPAQFFPTIVGSDQPGGYSGQYPPNRRNEVTVALTEAWAWLEGQGLLVRDPGYMGAHEIRLLSRKARRLAADPNPRRAISAHRLPKDTLHATIREDVWSLYHRGKYDTIIEASTTPPSLRR